MAKVRAVAVDIVSCWSSGTASGCSDARWALSVIVYVFIVAHPKLR